MKFGIRFVKQLGVLKVFSMAGALLFGLFTSVGTRAQAPATTPGNSPGAFSVNSNGAAVFRLALDVVRGVQDLQPGPAIVYNSQGHNGMLGLGFSLSGVSTITRCPETPRLDGRRGTVKWNAADKFCMDGRRMIRKTRKGDSFRLEKFGNNVIRAHGVCKGGPCHWQIVRPDGVVLEYGKSASQRISAGSRGVTATWLLSSVKDRNGNTMGYKYHVRHGRYYPWRIHYGNRQARVVQFLYEPRKDVELHYVAGVEVKTDWRLQRVRILYNNREVRRYHLSYGTSAITGRSLLSGVSLCAGDQCMAPTTFEWSAEDAGFDRHKLVKKPHFLRGDKTVLEAGDFNGDGRTDFLRREIGSWADADSEDTAHIYLADSKGEFTGKKLTDYKIMRGDKTRLIMGDFNGDGLLDYIRQEYGSYDDDDVDTAYVYLAKGDGTFTRNYVKAVLAGNGKPQRIEKSIKGDKTRLVAGDFNGDGITDFLRILKKKYKQDQSEVYLGRKDATFVRVLNSSIAELHYESLNFITGDYNGDGLTDFIRQEKKKLDNDDKRTAEVFLSKGDGSFRILPLTESKWMKGDYVRILPGDYNGDGLTDFIRQEKGKWDNNDKRTAELYLSKGDGTFAFRLLTDYKIMKGDRSRLHPGDYNGDGITDFVRQDWRRGKSSYLYISLGNGEFVQRKISGAKFIPGSRTRLLPGDYNGDGVTDLIRQEYGSWATADSSDTAHRYIARGKPLHINRIVNGMGGSHAVKYASLTRGGSLYTRGRSAKHPVNDVQPAMYVVSNVMRSDGRSGSYEFSYKYGGARVARDGGGWLGFEWTARREVASGIEARTYFHQKYELRGAVKESAMAKILSNGARIKLSRSSAKYQVKWYDNAHKRARSHAVLVTERNRTSYETGKSYRGQVLDTYDRENNLVTRRSIIDGARLPDLCLEYLRLKHFHRIGFVRRALKGDSCSYKAGKCSCSKVRGKIDLTYEPSRRTNLTKLRRRDGGGKLDVSVSYSYDRYGNRTAERGPYSTTAYTYVTGNETFVKSTTHGSRDGRFVHQVKWDTARGLPLSSTGLNGHTFYNEYDAFGRLKRRLGPYNGRRVELSRYEYGGRDRNASRNYIKTITPSGASIIDYQDGQGRVYRSDSIGAGSTISVERYFDRRGFLRKESLPFLQEGRNPRRLWTEIGYDRIGRPSSHRYPDGTKSSSHTVGEIIGGRFQRRVTEVAAAHSRDAMTIKRTKDARGRLIRIEFADGAVVRYAYDDENRVTKVQGPGGSIAFEYDSAGNMVKRTSSDAGTIRLEYDKRGRLLRSRDALNRVTTYKFDSFNRPTETVLPDGKKVIYKYDELKFRNGKGRITTAELHENNKLKSRYEYAYDEYGRRSAVRLTLADGRKYTHKLEYDREGRISQMTYPDGAVIKYEYDAQGRPANVSLREGGGGEFVTYAAFKKYNALGQAQEIAYGNGVESRRVYHAWGRLRSVRVGLGRKTYIDHGYSWNKLHEIVRIEDKLKRSLTRSFKYGAQGYLLQARGGFGTIDYKYDAAGNLTQKGRRRFVYRGNRLVSGPDGLKAEYDAGGKLTRRYSPEQKVWFYYNYDAGGRLVSVRRHKARTRGFGEVNRFEYNYAGGRIRKTDIKDGKETVTDYISPSYEVTRFADGRILHTKYVDGAGMRIASVSHARKDLTFWKYHSANLEASMYSLGSFVGVASFLKAGARAWLHYPYLKAILLDTILFLCVMLLSVVGLFALRRFFVRLRAGRAPPAWNFRVRHPVFAATVPLVLFCYLATLAFGTGLLIAGNGLHFKKIERNLLPGGNGAGYPIEGTYFFHGDHIGTVGLVTDARGAVVARTHYLPYGALDKSRSSGVDIFRGKFIGREWDGNSRLYYDNARYYDPNLGRFISPDSLTAGGTPFSAAFVNPYAYTENNPVTYSDPSGHFVTALIVGAIIGAYFGGQAVNGSYNPGDWNWKSPKTYGGIAAGAAIGAAGAGVGEAAVYYSGGNVIAGGIIGGAVAGAGENAAFAAMAGEDDMGILRSAGEGAVLGAMLGGLGEAAAGRRGMSGTRGARAALAEGGEEAGAQRNAACEFSFAAGTPIETGSGSRSIEDIREGDALASFDPVTGRVKFSRVTKTFQRTTSELLVVKTEAREYHVTAEHPFWVMGKGWLRADRLAVGDDLYSAREGRIKIESIARKKTSVRVYNFAVAKTSNYFLGYDGPLTHNCNALEDYKKALKRNRAEQGPPRADIRGRVDTYAQNQRAGTVGDMITPDHIPSHASNVAVAEDTATNAGRRLTRSNKRKIHRHGGTANVDDGPHKTGHTYGANNNRKKVKLDARHYRSAIDRDVSHYQGIYGSNIGPYTTRSVVRRLRKLGSGYRAIMGCKDCLFQFLQKGLR